MPSKKNKKRNGNNAQRPVVDGIEGAAENNVRVANSTQPNEVKEVRPSEPEVETDNLETPPMTPRTELIAQSSGGEELLLRRKSKTVEEPSDVEGPVKQSSESKGCEVEAGDDTKEIISNNNTLRREKAFEEQGLVELGCVVDDFHDSSSEKKESESESESSRSDSENSNSEEIGDQTQTSLGSESDSKDSSQSASSESDEESVSESTRATSSHFYSETETGTVLSDTSYSESNSESESESYSETSDNRSHNSDSVSETGLVSSASSSASEDESDDEDEYDPGLEAHIEALKVAATSGELLSKHFARMSEQSTSLCRDDPQYKGLIKMLKESAKWQQKLNTLYINLAKDLEVNVIQQENNNEHKNVLEIMNAQMYEYWSAYNAFFRKGGNLMNQMTPVMFESTRKHLHRPTPKQGNIKPVMEGPTTTLITKAVHPPSMLAVHESDLPKPPPTIKPSASFGNLLWNTFSFSKAGAAEEVIAPPPALSVNGEDKEEKEEVVPKQQKVAPVKSSLSSMLSALTSAEKKGKTVAIKENVRKGKYLKKKATPNSPLSVFGVKLEELPLEDTQFVPNFLHRLFQHLNKNAYKVEGIFRIPASSREVQRLMESVDMAVTKGKDVDWKEYNIHTVAQILKVWLRELPEPIVTYNQQNNFLAVCKGPESTQAEKLKTLINSLPTSNRLILKSVLSICHNINKHREQSKMDSQAISVIMGPNIFDAEEGDAITVANRVTLVMIANYDSLFPSIPALY